MAAKIVLLLYVLGLATTCLAGTVYYVDATSPNDPGSGSFSDPYRWIADAIDPAVASDGDTIIIRPGIYTGQKNRDLDPQGLSITIRSIDPNDSSIVANTIIDPNGAGRGFYFDSGEDADCVVSGLTVRNGLAADDSGGAILCYNSNPTISNCVIKNNTADWYGGALFCSSSSPAIIKCTITGNSAIDGGAIECWSGTTIVRNCIIDNNIASNNGGAIDCYWEGQAELYNCTVVMNSSDMGGALHCVDDGKATIRNSIFWYNNANEGTQIAVESSPFSASEVTISYSNLQGGLSAIRVDPESIINWGSGNIDTDPCFARFDPDGDPNVWDFHLKSAAGRWASSIYTDLDPTGDGFINLTDFAAFAGFWLQAGGSIPADLDDSGLVDLADLTLLLDNYLAGYLPAEWVNDDVTSPCIDAGDPNSDWSAEPWPNGKRINMGAYGGTPYASKNGNIADFDVSGQVNITDLMEFSSEWLSEDGGIVNLDSTGQVDFADFAIFADNWLWQRP